MIDSSESLYPLLSPARPPPSPASVLHLAASLSFYSSFLSLHWGQSQCADSALLSNVIMPKKEVDMVSPFVSDGHLSSVSDDLFDFDVVNQCDYDFPMEDLEGNQMPEDWVARLQHLELPPDDLTCGLSTPFTVKLFDDNSLSYTSSSKEDSKPKLEDSSLANTEIAAHRKIFHHVAAREGKDSSLFPNFSSAVSVLKSSGVNSWSAADNSLHVGYKFFIPVKRARSKRLRPPTLNPRLTIPFMVSYERRKVRKKILPSDASETEEPETPGGPNWKCTHCEMTKTPQWREGPMGPKTLCNACGVRYRSGRLYPEYRPAASPTFVASVHSNSHRKVVEMRNKGGSSVEVPVAAVASLRRAPQLGGNPNGCHRLSV